MRTHGRISTYHAGCRCEDCTAAARDARRRTRLRRDRPFACRWCPATFANAAGRGSHEAQVHPLGGFKCPTPVPSSGGTP